MTDALEEDQLMALRLLVEAHVEQLRATHDLTTTEVRAFLVWLAAFAELQLAEIDMEVLGGG